jgi:hypothetical protein
MQVPVQLVDAFGASFEELIAQFAVEKGLLPDVESLQNRRFLTRSVVPHVRKLSALFNRLTPKPKPGDPDDADFEDGEAELPPLPVDQAAGLDPYWKQSSNPARLRLAYFLYFMPSNLFRVASIWTELGRLGFQWKGSSRLRGIEFGSGPAAGATGVAAGEKQSRLGLPVSGDWALIEQDRAALKLGAEWAQRFFQNQDFPDWGTRTFQRTIDVKQGFLPPTAPKFNVWVMSFFLNEILGEKASAEQVAKALLDSWEKHLEDESIIILVEPALKLQSRKLLALRQEILTQAEKRKMTNLKLLLPCLGHQICGAFAVDDDWCHEEVSWWRPPYFKAIDQMAGLDRKTLPFSYLVFAKSSRTREELLPALAGSNPALNQRLVSPAHSEGKELEFYLCGEAGKRRARYHPIKRPKGPDSPEYKETLQRGDILVDAELRGDVNASRVDRFKKKL